MIDVILGLQWGDEGKGKIVDYFSANYDIIARYQGGPNAGHTLYYENKKVVLHQVPSGIFNKNKINIIGNGVVLDPIIFKKEVQTILQFNIHSLENLIISETTNIIIPTHKILDKAAELAKKENKIGSTLKGIGPAYMDKTGRNALRVGDIFKDNFIEVYNKLKEKHLTILQNTDLLDNLEHEEKLFFEAAQFLKQFKVVNSTYYINDALIQGKKILAEGAQGTMLDIDFGTFPFVTSSNTITAGVCTGLGVAPNKINKIFGITKAYCTRVGSGPFPTELLNETGNLIRNIGNEFGSTTGRERRCGWLDLVALHYACIINGVTDLIITKADILDDFKHIELCTS
ncbi:MAG: adenylosuccinate synthase, partial [Sediminibacterium sp.]|nr:adenylosuccinate synthase [Sediminibacterium sp.]